MPARRSSGGLGVTPLRLVLLAVYLALVLGALMLFHVGLVPNVLIFVLLGAAVVIGQARLFARDWGVFLLVLVLWQQTEWLATWAGFPMHLGDLVAADRWIASPFLHGQLPQVWLQDHLLHVHRVIPDPACRARGPASWQWYDAMSWAVYALHFPEPLLVGFAIWLRDRPLFRRFAVAFLALAAMAFVVYIVYPAVPPWLAGRVANPMTPGRPVITPCIYNVFNQFNYWVLERGLGQADKPPLLPVRYDVTAAMPSLHAAFPVLSALYLRKRFGNRGLLMLLYGGVVWFSVVYMGEHWIVDVAVGVVFALASYAVVEYAARRRVAQHAVAQQPGACV